MLKSKVFQRYFLPGFLFQSIVIGGGYGTGRELVEYFLKYGPLGGLFGMILTTLIWCAVCTVTFELARITHSFDYRTFTRQLLNRWWFFYEFCYLAMMLLGLSVIAAAGGSIIERISSVPYNGGVIGIMFCIGFLVFKGSSFIENILSVWSLILYAVYFILFGYTLSFFLTESPPPFLFEIRQGWAISGIKYAAYNLVVIPALLFCIRHIRTSKEAFGAGILAGPIAMIPAFLFLLAMTNYYPRILNETVPANYILEMIGSLPFQVIFQIVLVGTLIESGTGVIHAFNERLSSVFIERKSQMPLYLRPLIAMGLLTLAYLGAQFGLETLISKGYGTVTWAVLFCYVLPALSIGVWKIRNYKKIHFTQ